MELKELSKSEELLFQLAIEKAKHYQNAAIAYSNLNQGDSGTDIENMVTSNIDDSRYCLEKATKMLYKDPNDIKPIVPEDYTEELLRTKLRDLDLSTRTINCLHAFNIIEIGHVIQHTKNDLLLLPNFGTRSLDELIKVLGSKGLTLGTAIDFWPKREVVSKNT